MDPDGGLDAERDPRSREQMTPDPSPRDDAGTRNKLGAGEPLCACGKRAFAKPADVPLCKAHWREDRVARGIICTAEGCTRAGETRGQCESHARRLRASGQLIRLTGDHETTPRRDPVTGRVMGLAGRPKINLPGQMPARLREARATPLSRWLRKGELKSKPIRDHVEQLAVEIAASLGGASMLSAQQAVAIEHLALSRVSVLLALNELGERGAFGSNNAGDRVASAGYQALVKSLAESRQQLSQLGMDRRAAPVTFDAIVKEAAERAEQDAEAVQDAELVAPAVEAQS
jgi:hypothetical protein